MSELPTLELSIGGMTCANCAGRIERALAKVPGVQTATVNLASERAHVQLVSIQSPAALIAAIERAGYTAVSSPAGAAPRSASRREYWNLIAALLLALPLLLPMFLQPLGIHWMLPAALQWALATPVQFIIGARFYQAAWRALRTLDGNMDLLVAVGTSAGYGLSVYLWLASSDPAPHLYFEASAMVIALVLLGKHLENRARRHTGLALRELQNLRGDKALRQVDGEEQTVAVGDLRLGDILIIKPGARFAADGEITEGRSHVDESLISGEHLPVAKQPGDRVTGGALNGEGQLLVRVEALGRESILSRMIRLVEDAQAQKAPIQYLVDRISRVFVPVVLLVSLLTLMAWLMLGASTETAVLNAVAVLVIACPCALGLATPAAVMAGTGAAARHGILIKDSAVLQQAHGIDCVVFDKTGTLTLGKPYIAHQWAANGETSAMLRLAGALQQGSEHPLARAVLEQCQRQQIVLPPVLQSRALPGRGIAGRVEHRALQLGNDALLDDLHLRSPSLTQAWEAQGCTLSWLVETGTPGQVLGVLAFADQVRPGAAAAVARLQSSGRQCHLLTGDNRGSAAQVAAAVGIVEVQAQVLPADKAAVIQTLQARHRVAMVGDGINDGPALAQADLGMAMASGTDVAMQAAAITLMRSDPRMVPAALDICQRTYGKIRQNLFWAFSYNMIGIPLAASGLLSPVLAGSAMALSSVSVVLNALWLNRWQPDLPGDPA